MWTHWENIGQKCWKSWWQTALGNKSQLELVEEKDTESEKYNLTNPNFTNLPSEGFFFPTNITQLYILKNI